MVCDFFKGAICFFIALGMKPGASSAVVNILSYHHLAAVAFIAYMFSGVFKKKANIQPIEVGQGKKGEISIKRGIAAVEICAHWQNGRNFSVVLQIHYLLNYKCVLFVWHFRLQEF